LSRLGTSASETVVPVLMLKNFCWL